MVVAARRAKSLHLRLIAIRASLVLLEPGFFELGFEISVLRKRQFCVFFVNL